MEFKLTNARSVDFGRGKIVENFATGTRPKPSSQWRRAASWACPARSSSGRGIAFCATCDAAANTGKEVLVAGSGDAAIEEGIF